jgi:hypothetical protein
VIGLIRSGRRAHSTASSTVMIAVGVQKRDEAGQGLAVASELETQRAP